MNSHLTVFNMEKITKIQNYSSNKMYVALKNRLLEERKNVYEYGRL